MTKENYNKLIELQKEVAAQAKTMLEDFTRHAISILSDGAGKDDTLFKLKFSELAHVCYQYIEDESIVYTGEEFWSYGGHESHRFVLPLSYLFDENWLEIETAKFHKTKADHEAAKIAEQNRVKEREMKKLAELQAKYSTQ